MSEWWKSAVIYQVYPRSFQDSGGDGVGDLPGITRRLEHIASLGVDVIWLAPFFKSPMKDMGYDVSDQTDVDPLFGTLSDFDVLLEKAHRLGLKVIIDQVPSHTSDQHAWFVESRTSRSNDKSDWYVWADPKPDATPPNNWLSVFGGPAWTWEPQRRQYYMHSFLTTQPQLNYHNPEVADAMLATMRFWLDRGVDGFRLDTINYPFHSEALEDNPPDPEATEGDWVNPYDVQRHLYDKNRPETLEFLTCIRALLDEFPGSFAVGEVGEGRHATPIMQAYTQPGRLHMAYSFKMLGADFSAAHFAECVGGFFDGSGGWPCWAFSNHDVKRHASRWGGTENSESVARLAIALMVSLPGTKCLYQGEELGQVETDLEYSEIVDPPGLKFWPEFKGRDGCRTPMVWETDAPHAGFTTGEPWLPVKAPQAARAVDLQEGDDGSVLQHYRRVLAFYKIEEAAALRDGDLTLLDVGGPVFAIRRSGKTTITAVFNLSDASVRLAAAGGTRPLGPGHGNCAGGAIDLPPFGWQWLAGETHLTLI